MPNRAVIDSGPLIALFDRDDQYHVLVCDFLRGYRGRLYSSLAVLTEVAHLLDFSVGAQLDFLRWVADGAVELVDLHTEDLKRICVLTEKYSDWPMDLADATLVVIAEQLKIKSVVSVDSDFYVYRKLGNGYLQNLLSV